KRGGGRYVSTWQRDRGRALQLMQQALPLAGKEADKKDASGFHLNFARLLLNGVGWHEAWRLQYLTDLSKLPDYDEGYRYWWRGESRGAPVDEQNRAVLHKVPRSYKEAASDGERWRWLLLQAVELNPDCLSEVDMTLAYFFRGQLGVQSMSSGGWNPPADQG